MTDGILVVKKEKEYTSFDVVAVVRKLAGQKKVGHGGTLDPMAEGVLPVFLGNATRLCDLQEESDKTYEAGILLGTETDTEDIWGTVLNTREVLASPDEVLNAVMSFEGPYLQCPPMYSAKKIGGKKLYELAREGKTVERKSVPVEIRKISVLRMALPELTIRVTCSKGTYIRSLARDIGEKLGTGAVMNALVRISHGRFTLDQAHRLSEIRKYAEEGRLHELVIPVEEMFSTYPALHLKPEGDRFLKNGNRIPEEYAELTEKVGNGTVCRTYLSDGIFFALYRYHAENGCFSAEKMFPPSDRG